jgi:hypothetical protein
MRFSVRPVAEQKNGGNLRNFTLESSILRKLIAGPYSYWAVDDVAAWSRRRNPTLQWSDMIKKACKRGERAGGGSAEF